MLSITAMFDSVGSMLSRLQSLILNWCRTSVRMYCATVPHTEFIIKTAAIFSMLLRASLFTATDANVRKNAFIRLNLFGNFRFRTGYLEIRCSKSCYLCDFKLDDLLDNGKQAH